MHGESFHQEINSRLYLLRQRATEATKNISIVFLEFAQEDLVDLALVLLRLEALLNNVR